MAQAVCELTNDVDPSWKVETPDHCGNGEGTLVVYPRVTTTYTFTDKENPSQSRDAWQVKSLVVPVVSEFSGINVTWEPAPGYQSDDPMLKYTGTAAGPLSNLVAVLTGMSRVRCGFGGRGEYSQLRAQMSFN